MEELYVNFEDKLYEALAEFFPNTVVVHAYENQPETKTPYIVINVLSLDPIGGEYTAGLTDENSNLATIQNFEGLVRLEFHGKDASVSGNLAQHFVSTVRHPNKNYLFGSRKISVMRLGQPKKISKKRDTQFYTSYVVDVFFAYSTAYSEEVATVESVVIDGELTPDGGTISIEISTEIE